VSCGDRFGNRGHSNGVSTNRAEGSNLGGRLVTRPVDGHVDAVAHCYVPCTRGFIGDGSQPARVDLAHVRKTHTETLVVRPHQRITSEHIDVIVDDHQCALSEPRIDAARGIREDDLLHAKPGHDARREDDGRQIMPFIEMNPTRQCGNAPARHVADNEATRMTHHVRRWPVWQCGVTCRHWLLQRVGEIS
jgi:hypothetical protein